ncbi:MAG TPA: hypothetical protein VHP99_05995, partial [Pyrinomonadaceae bacterium]|nr:hypothetical protein [Pyrinomonadaceae bacterium]
MKVFVTILLAIAVAFSPFRFVSGQEQSPQKPDDVLRVRSSEVRLDIVVKDKKGHAVKDLTPADFEVLEDGVAQRIQAFRFVNGETLADPGSNRNADRKEGQPETSPITPPRRTTPGVTALVFDRLSPEARSLARRAGTAYAQEGMAAGDFTGVFRIDQSLTS